MELEQDRSLPFMDCLVKRMENGDLSVSVYRKSTHTDRYLHYTSHHPLHVRRGVVRCLLDRARKLITNEADLEVEVKHLREVFIAILTDEGLLVRNI